MGSVSIAAELSNAMCITCLILLSVVGVGCDNVTRVSVPSINDACSDNCAGDDPFYWCEEKRKDGEGGRGGGINAHQMVTPPTMKSVWTNVLAGGRKGEDYYWCNLPGSKWDCCSPSPRLG